MCNDEHSLQKRESRPLAIAPQHVCADVKDSSFDFDGIQAVIRVMGEWVFAEEECPFRLN
jgi:hypothetical protein